MTQTLTGKAGREAAGAAKAPQTVAPNAVSGREWFFNRLQSRLEEGFGVWVVAAEPGWGKTVLARQVAARIPGAVMATVREAGEFWQELDARLPGSPGNRPATRFSVLQRLKSSPLFVVDNLDRLQVEGQPRGLHGLEACPCPVLAFTRPGPHLRNLEVQGHVVEHLVSRSPENIADLAQYLQNKPMQAAEIALSRSFGNFLIAQSLVTFGLQREDSIHRVLWQLVEETLERVNPELHHDMIRVLCLLSEAGEALHERYLADFLGLPAARVQHLLSYLEPLLSDQGNGRFLLFNPWLSRTLSSLLMRDMEPVHAGIIAHFRETFPSWEEMTDGYGWQHLAHHCDRYARTARRRDFSVLHWLAEGPFARLKLKKTRNLGSVLADLRRGLIAALEDNDLPRIVYYGFQIPRTRREWAAKNLHELADLGNLAAARDHALLLHSEAAQFKGLLLLAWQAADEGQNPLAHEILDLALQVPLPELEQDELPLIQRICASLLSSLPERQSDILQLLDREENPSRSARNFLTLGLMDSLEDRLRLLSLEEGKERTRLLPSPDQDQLLRFISKSLCSLQRPDLAASLQVALETPNEIADRKAFQERLARLSNERSEPRLVDSLLGLTEKLLSARPRPEWLHEALGLAIQSLINLRSSQEKTRAMFHLSRDLMLLGPSDATVELFDRLLKIAETLEDLACQSRVLADLGVSLFRLKEFVRSNNLISQAAAKAFQLEDPLVRGSALAFVAGATSQIGHNVRARDLAFNSLESLESSGAGHNDYNCCAALRVSIMTSISIERSVECFQQSVDDLRRAEGIDPKLRSLALGTLAEGVFRLGAAELARTWLNQALAVARVMDAGWQQSQTLAKLAIYEFEMGDRQRFEQVIQEALESLASESDPGHRAEALMAVSEARRIARDPRSELVLQTVLRELDRIPPTDLPHSRALALAATRARQTAQTEMVEHLFAKAREAGSQLEGEDRDYFYVGLLKAELAFGDFASARHTRSRIHSTRLRSQAARDLAVAFMLQDPDEAIGWISQVQLRQDRLQAVLLCTMELQKELRPSRQEAVKRAMAQLTLLATEDEATADVVLSRWLTSDPEHRDLERTARKMGWLSDGTETGNTVPLRSH